MFVNRNAGPRRPHTNYIDITYCQTRDAAARLRGEEFLSVGKILRCALDDVARVDYRCESCWRCENATNGSSSPSCPRQTLAWRVCGGWCSYYVAYCPPPLVSAWDFWWVQCRVAKTSPRRSHS